MIRALHERAIEAADLIFYSSRKFLAEAEHGREKSHLLEQAVDFEHWSKINRSAGDAKQFSKYHVRALVTLARSNHGWSIRN